MTNLYFSPPVPGQEIVSLALACGVGGRAGGAGEHPLSGAALSPLRQQGPDLWRVATDLAGADVAVYSNLYDGSAAAHRFADAARAAGVGCLFFDSRDDDDGPRDPPYGWLYRTSLRADRRGPRERAMPPVCRDVLAAGAGSAGAGTVAAPPAVPVRPAGGRPVVSFCGYVSPWWRQAVRRARGERAKVLGHVVRSRALTALRRAERAERVTTRFVVRREYAGGSLGFRDDPARVEAVFREYASNLLDGDYALSARGAGNFSLRFFEALSAGRVPLLVDSGGGLPLAGRIDWSRHCVIVPEGELAAAGERVAEFHAALDDQRYAELQAANRRLWDEWLSPVAFHRAVVEAAVRHEAV